MASEEIYEGLDYPPPAPRKRPKIEEHKYYWWVWQHREIEELVELAKDQSLAGRLTFGVANMSHSFQQAQIGLCLTMMEAADRLRELERENDRLKLRLAAREGNPHDQDV